MFKKVKNLIVNYRYSIQRVFSNILSLIIIVRADVLKKLDS